MENKEYFKVIEYIKEQMKNGTIQIGGKLETERKLSEKLGISRPSIREALRSMENIGLIEVMGLAVLPARLKTEMEQLEAAILSKEDLTKDETLAIHADWAAEVVNKHPEMKEDNIHEIIQQEIGLVFAKVLEHAGVYKRDMVGKEAFMKFIHTL